MSPPNHYNKKTDHVDKLVPGRISSFVGGIGLEPTTFAMSTQRSNQLS